MSNRKSAIEVFDSCADLYEEKFMELDLYQTSLDIFCHTIQSDKAAVLELACGPGNITKYIASNQPNYEILATDLAPKMLELAKKNIPTAQFQLMDSRSISKLDKKFDAVICGFCLPYLSKEEAITLIADIADQLNSDGVLYLSTMEDDYGKSDWLAPSSGDGPSVYTYYHEGDYLVAAMEKNGFEIEYINRQVYPEHAGMTKRDLIIIAKK